MALRIADFHKVPPGNYFYVQTFERAGQTVTKHFQGTPEAGTLAARVARYRKANQLPRDNALDALEDISDFTCNRLPKGNRWCAETDKPWGDIVAAAYGPNCKTCGHTNPE